MLPSMMVIGVTVVEMMFLVVEGQDFICFHLNTSLQFISKSNGMPYSHTRTSECRHNEVTLYIGHSCLQEQLMEIN